MEHTWTRGKCRYCGAGRQRLDRGEGRETHAYAFIHTDDIKTRAAELFGGDMQFDVIIGILMLRNLKSPETYFQGRIPGAVALVHQEPQRR